MVSAIICCDILWKQTARNVHYTYGYGYENKKQWWSDDWIDPNYAVQHINLTYTKHNDNNYVYDFIIDFKWTEENIKNSDYTRQ